MGLESSFYSIRILANGFVRWWAKGASNGATSGASIDGKKLLCS
jgi:hypothetical protein